MEIETVRYHLDGYMINDELTIYNGFGAAKEIWDDLQIWLETNTPLPDIRPPEVLEQERTDFIKKEASKRIKAIYPEWKQRNMTAAGLVLTEKLASGGTLTAEEQVQSDALKAAWAQIDAIRQTSNQAELDGTALEDIIWP